MASGEIILIVEDNTDVANMLRARLESEGYLCEHVTDGEQALAAVRRRPPHLILLDRVLPRVSGDDVARQLKSDPRSRAIPLIMLTGKGEESDELVGFALGADDYISKPFSPKVLLARIEAHLRRRRITEEQHEEMPAVSVRLDRSQPRVFIDKTPISLTSTEYRILATLMAAGGTILDGQRLAAMVYGKEQPPDERRLRGLVGGLRRKMGPAGTCIQAVSENSYAYCHPNAPPASA